MKMPSLSARIIIWWVCIFAVILMIHIPAWPGEFAYDEFRTVVNNPCTSGEAPVTKLLTSDLWCLGGSGATASYRPVPALWARALYSVAGADVVVYRLGSLFLYSIITGLFALLLVRLGLSAGFAVAGTTLFAVMGVHIEAALSAASISDLMFTLFALALLIWSLGENRWKTGGILVGVCLFVLALLSKESAMALVPAVIVVDIMRSGSREAGVKRTVILYLAFGLVIASYLFIRFQLFGHLGVAVQAQDNPLASTGAIAQFYGALAALGKGVCLMLIPGMWSLEHAGCTIRWEFAVIGGMWLLSSAGIFLWAFSKKNLPLMFAVLLYWVGVGVSSNLLVVGPSLLAERQLLLASGGVVVLLLLAGQYIMTRWEMSRRFVVLFFALFIVLQAGGTMLRASDWSSEERLYRSAALSCPGSFKMQVNLAHWLRTHGVCYEAAVQFQSILSSAPGAEQFYLYRELGYSLHLCAQYDAAIVAYNKALKLRGKPDSAIAFALSHAQQKSIPTQFLENQPYR